MFVVALLGGLVARRLGQPLIVGYVLGGIFAEIGVILLMYSIGIEFSLADLLRVKWVALVGGPPGIFASIAMGVAAGRLMGWSVMQSVAIGALVSLAALRARAGDVGITLVDDLVFVVLIVLLPVLADMSGSRLVSIGLAFGKALLVLAPVVLIRTAPTKRSRSCLPSATPSRHSSS